MTGPVRVLYAEDNPQNLKLVRAHFAEHAKDFTIETVRTGRECLGRLQRGAVDVVLLENRLPDMDGIDVLRQLRASGSHPPVVLITGMGDENLVVRALRLGAANYVPRAGQYLETLPEVLRAAAEGDSGEHGPRPGAASPVRILYAEHHQADLELTLRHFAEAAPHFAVDIVHTGAEALSRLAQPNSYDLLLLDLRMPDQSALDFVREARLRVAALPPIVIVTGQGDDATAIAALRLGAADYIVKRDGYLNKLPPTIERAIAHERLRRANQQLERALAEQSRVEEALRENEARLEQAQAQAHLGSWEIDQETQVAEWSPEMFRSYGRDPAAGAPTIAQFWELVDSRARKLLTVTSRAALEQDEPLSVEYETVPIQGKRRYLLATFGRVLDPAGRPIRLTGTVLDITDRRRAELAAAENERKLRFHLQNTPVAAIEWDADFRVTSWNLAAERIFGYSAAEAMGQHASFIVPESRRPGIEAAFARLMSQSGGQHGTNENVTRDGRTVVCEWFNTPLTDSDGRVIGVASLAQDVTERHRAERELRESEERYRLLVDESPYAIAVHQDGAVVFANRAAVELVHAKSAQDLIGLPIAAIVHPDGLAADQDRIARMIQGEQGLYPVDDRYVRLDGSVVDVEVTAAPFIYNGRPAIQVIALDISARKQAEAALRETEEHLRATFELAAVGISHIGPDGRLLRVNQKLCEIVGYTREELLQKSFPEITHPDDWQSDLEGARRLVAGETQTYSAEKRYIRKDGAEVWVDLTTSLVRTPEGEPDYFISVTDDITARKQAEAALELRSAALEATPSAIAITGRQGAIEWVNPSFVALNGYSQDEVIGRNPAELLESSAQGIPVRDLWGTVLSGAGWRGEVQNRRKDGSNYLAEATITPVRDASGVVTRLVWVARDITERKRLEAQFLQAQKMEAVGQLAGGIAHDFNNLLNVIMGTAALASEQLRPDDPVRNDLREITQASERAAVLTRQLLAFSRKQTIQPKVLDLGATVLAFEGMLRRLIGEDVDLRVDATAGAGGIVADPAQVEQVILNLAVNAKDAMPNGGALTIAVAPVSVGQARADTLPALEAGPYVSLTVTDTGTGMDEATRARIFEPFFTTKEVGRGTGLGLATVYGIVQQSGGSILVESEPGQGTAFTIWFPAAGESTPAASGAPAAAPARGAETILVVEDYAGLRALARRMLERAGYTVLAAANGNEALELLASHSGAVDLILTDVVMPGMDGSELAERLRETNPGLKVIFTSGYTDDSLLRHGIDASAGHLLVKPYSNEDLTRAVRTVLDSR
jgi:PAS domain S-box-containing protein